MMKIFNIKKLPKLIFILLALTFVILTITLKLSYVLSVTRVKFIYTLLIVSFLTLLLPFQKGDKFYTLFDYLTFLINAIILALILSSLILMRSKVEGSSMEHTYKDGDKVFVYMFKPNYKRGNVIVYDESDQLIIKRLVAVQGDTIQLKLVEDVINESNHLLTVYINDEVYINKYGERYTLSNQDQLYLDIKLDKYILKKNEIIVFGDNATGSRDSRNTGISNTKYLVGKVLGE